MYTNLFKVKRFSEETCKFYAGQLVLALGILHAHKIVHRDLKPENVLIAEDGYIKLADFGLAKFLTGPNQTSNTVQPENGRISMENGRSIKMPLSTSSTTKRVLQ